MPQFLLLYIYIYTTSFYKKYQLKKSLKIVFKIKLYFILHLYRKTEFEINQTLSLFLL